MASVRTQVQQTLQDRMQLAREQTRMLQEASAATRKEFFAPQVGRYYNYERHLARCAVEKDAQLAQLRSLEDLRRRELEAASKEKRIVEKLREHHEERMRRLVAKQEQLASDEVAVGRAAMDREKGRGQ